MTPGRAVLTGAARRLGRAMALALAEDGWDVAISYEASEEPATALASEIEGMGRRAAAIRANLLDRVSTGELIAAAADALGGPLTLLVNNASIFENDRIETMTSRSWERAIDSNLRGPVELTRDFAAQAPEASRDEIGEATATGLVVNMLDQRVWSPRPAFVSYAVAKEGLFAFTRMAAQELAPRIRVNAIGPGPTLRAERQSEENFRRQRLGTPLRRGPDPADVVGALRYFVAARAVTGQMLAVDGGEHLLWPGAHIAEDG